MKAAVITQYGKPVEVKEIELPELKERDLLVEVYACATNPVDYKVRNNFGKTDESVPNGYKLVGWDASGRVVQVGSKCELFQVGDEVYFSGELTRTGTHAEKAIVDERLVGKKPQKISHDQAAAFPLTTLTAWEGLFESVCRETDQEFWSKDKSVLIINGSGGVGSIAIQLLKVLTPNVTVIATAGKDASVQFCKRMGADHVINHRQNLQEQLKQLSPSVQSISSNGEVDVIFNCTSTDDYFDTFKTICKPLASIILISEAHEKVDIFPLMSKRVNIVWEFMFSRSLFNAHMEKQGNILNRVSKFIDDGKIVTTMNTHYTNGLDDVEKALTAQEGGQVVGKQVIQIKSQ